MVLRPKSLEGSILRRSKKEGAWEGCGDAFEAGWRLRMKISASSFFWDDNQKEREGECLLLRGELR